MNDSLLIDLSSHHDSKGFVAEMEKKYPDKDVSLSLEGDKMGVVIDQQVPLQLQIDISSFLIKRAKEAVHGL